jgi:hypothetical protein
MSGGWRGAVGADDVNSILSQLSGDEDGSLPRGMVGLTPTAIANGATTDVNCPMSAWMRVARLVLNPAAVVDLSYVQDIKIGTISLNIGTQPITCAAFARDAVGTSLEAAVWASPSVPPVVRIFNNTAASITYSGGIFGRVSLVRPEGASA